MFVMREVLFERLKSVHCKKKFTEFLYFFFTKPFRNGKTPHADKGFFGAFQRRNFLSFEEGKVFLFLQR
jgi:hypothetical protein